MLTLAIIIIVIVLDSAMPISAAIMVLNSMGAVLAEVLGLFGQGRSHGGLE